MTSDHVYAGCSAVDEAYEKLEKLGEGTFGEVHKARQKTTKLLVALKRIFYHNEKEGFPLTALREIKILRDLDHANIIPLVDMAVKSREDMQPESVDKKDAKAAIYMVSPYMDHDLCGLLRNKNVNLELPHIKCYMKQLLEGMKFMHDRGYMHRDIKTANILIDNHGIVKIADFGLARKTYEEPPQVGRQGTGPAQHRYTQMVVTRWYRPIELIFGAKRYTTAIDMWGIGCVFGEMYKKKPILPGKSELDQGQLIFQLMGSPSPDTMPQFEELMANMADFQGTKFGPYKRQLESVFNKMDPAGQSLLSGLLDLNYETRFTAVNALAHKFFTTEPLAARPDQLPTYAPSHEMDTNNAQANVPHAPNVDNVAHPNYHNPSNTHDTYNHYNNQYNGHNNINYYQHGHNDRRHYDDHGRRDRYHNDRRSRGRNHGRGRGGGGRNNHRRDDEPPPTYSARQPPYRQSSQNESRATAVPPYRRNEPALPQKPLAPPPPAPQTSRGGTPPSPSRALSVAVHYDDDVDVKRRRVD